MASTENSKTDNKQDPKSKTKNGGAKGGTRYPKDNLEKCVIYAKKLVSKTHNGPQPESIILNGVFGSSTNPGKIRLSSTKQFGFLQGDAKGYSATELAKKINSAPPEEIQNHLIESLFIPKIFKTLYDTFANDVVNDSKLKQQVLNLDVHPDNADECVKVFKESIIFAQLAQKLDDDKLEVSNTNSLIVKHDYDDEIDSELEEDELDEQTLSSSHTGHKSKGGISNINVNIDVDPSMDPEKLEKLLKLLKTYGAI